MTATPGSEGSSGVAPNVAIAAPTSDPQIRDALTGETGDVPTGDGLGGGLPPLAPDPNPPTPMSWRLAILVGVVALGLSAYALRDVIGLRGQSAAGAVCFVGVVALFSQNLRSVNWQTIGCGILLQLALAWIVLNVKVVYEAFQSFGNLIQTFLNFAQAGSKFVFGNLYDARPPDAGGTWTRLFPDGMYEFQFAFVALPPILFVSAFFTVLYHFGILQFVVRWMARVMVVLLRTSGAETLAASANVFMGQTEAPLIVKPYVPTMTTSELFTLMVSGMATVSGGMMAVYIGYGADPVAVLTTCVMAAPCSLYLVKLYLPETETPQTGGDASVASGKSPFVNAIDAVASGTSDGLALALNVAAMLIVFTAFVAMADALLAALKPMLLNLGLASDQLEWWPDGLSLSMLFGWVFAPVAFLMGVDLDDCRHIGALLGSKLAINELFAFLQLRRWMETPDFMTQRSFRLAAFALTGFANFASIGIQLGGIGALAPNRRHDLARLGGRALFVGFTATLVNAAVAGMLMGD